MASNLSTPLSVDEVVFSLRQRWQVAYDLQLVVRGKRLYLQMMWAFLEQKSFPLDECSYRVHIGEVIEVVNRLGLSDEVRVWLATERQKPKVGKALYLPLISDERLEEFVL